MRLSGFSMDSDALGEAVTLSREAFSLVGADMVLDIYQVEVLVDQVVSRAAYICR